MWLMLAAGSAALAGLTAILAKVGIRHTDSTLATAIRTVVVLIFCWVMVLLAGSFSSITSLTGENWLFLVLSGLATGASWLCYFRALQLGDVNQVVPIDKSSTVLTMLLALFLLGEGFSLWKGACMAAIGRGTLLMIQRTAPAEKQGGARSLVLAGLSALFASLTAILAKVGMTGVESNLATAIRTSVVLVMAWGMVAVTGKGVRPSAIPRRGLLFFCLSGLATGGSWLCYFSALQTGPASVVVPVDKLSILVTAAFSWLVLRERLSRRALLGLALMTAGTVGMCFG